MRPPDLNLSPDEHGTWTVSDTEKLRKEMKAFCKNLIGEIAKASPPFPQTAPHDPAFMEALMKDAVRLFKLEDTAHAG